MASEGGRDGRGGHVPGDRWESVPTGYWLVSWGSGMSWCAMPFDEVRCASEEVARRVVDEIVRWITRNPWGDTPGSRLVRHEVRPIKDGYDGYDLIGWREIRNVATQAVTDHVTVDGEAYTRTRDVVEYGPWKPAAARRVFCEWAFRPAADGSTDAVQIYCWPEVVTVLVACGVSDGEE